MSNNGNLERKIYFNFKLEANPKLERKLNYYAVIV